MKLEAEAVALTSKLARAQAICLQTRDFRRAYETFAAKSEPRSAGD
jgi:hypothetical protein